MKKEGSSNSENRRALKPKISMTTLGVRDIVASLAFYRDGLGFPPHNYVEGQDCVMFKLEGTRLALYRRASLADDATVPSCGSGFPGFVWRTMLARRSWWTRLSRSRLPPARPR